jgi:WD40 repeat protein
MKKNYCITFVLFFIVTTNYAMEEDSELHTKPSSHETNFLELQSTTQNQKKLLSNFIPQQQLSLLASLQNHEPLLNLKKNRLALLQQYALHDEDYGCAFVHPDFDEFLDDFKKAYTTVLDENSNISREEICVPSLKKKRDQISQFCTSPDGSLVVVASSRRIRIYDRQSKKWTKNKEKIRVKSIGISQCGNKLAIAGWKKEKGKRKKIKVHHYNIIEGSLTNKEKIEVPWAEQFEEAHKLDQKIVFSLDCKKLFFFCNNRLFRIELENNNQSSYLFSEIVGKQRTVNEEGNVAFLKKKNDGYCVEQQIQGSFEPVESCIADLHDTHLKLKVMLVVVYSNYLLLIPFLLQSMIPSHKICIGNYQQKQ